MRFVPREVDDQVNLPQEHPLRNAAELVAAVTVLGLLVWLLVAFFVDIAVAVIPPSREAELMASWMHERAAEQSDPARSAAVQALLTSLAAGWADNPYRFQVTITDDEEPNAFAAPGGLILVTQGLLDQCASENELALVLGHEVGHYRGRDHLRSLGRGVLFQLLLSLAGVGGDTAPLRTPSALAALSSSREQERQADLFGLGLVQRHYGHVNGSWSFFEKVRARGGVGQAVPAFLSTHPGSEGRVAALRAHAQAQGWPLTGALLPAL